MPRLTGHEHFTISFLICLVSSVVAVYFPTRDPLETRHTGAKLGCAPSDKQVYL
jgi:hypothetical protein